MILRAGGELANLIGQLVLNGGGAQVSPQSPRVYIIRKGFCLRREYICTVHMYVPCESTDISAARWKVEADLLMSIQPHYAAIAVARTSDESYSVVPSQSCKDAISEWNSHEAFQ
jgi:hypothetical protein